MKYIRIIWIAYCGFVAIMLFLELMDFMNDSSKHPIGMKISWAYESETNYIITGVIAVSWFSLGCILGFIKKAKVFFIVHILIYLVLIIRSCFVPFP